MTARKSLPRRLSRYSIQSQISGVLDPDSNVNSYDESQPLWFQEFENNSINIRPSARFSLAQNESPILDSNSEPESTPLEKSWWKKLDDTPKVRPSISNVSIEKSNIPESTNLESSDASLPEAGVARKRLFLRNTKRKNLERNVFSEILNASEDTIDPTKIRRKTKSVEKQDGTISPSDTDVSVKKVRKLMFKKKRKTKLVRKSSNLASKSDESLPSVFRKVLDASQSSNGSRHEATAPNVPESSLGNEKASFSGSPKSAETYRPEPDHSQSENRGIASAAAEDTRLGDESSDGSRSSVIMPRLKKQTIFPKATKRRTANFDALLNDESEDERLLELNQSERRDEPIAQPAPELVLSNNNLDQEDESDTEESIEKQRVPFNRKKRHSRGDKIFAQALVSPNTSVRSEPVSAGKQTPDLEAPGHKILWSDAKRRTSQRRRTLADTSGSLNVETEENQSSRKLSRLSNKSDAERRSTSRINIRAEISAPSDVELEDQSASIEIGPTSIGDKSGNERGSLNKKNANTSRRSNIELEKNQSPSKLIRRSTTADKSNVEKRSMNKTNDGSEDSGLSDVELENQSAIIENGPFSIGDKSVAERRSTNEKQDLSTSLNAEEEENQSVNTPSRRSIGSHKPHDSDRNKSSSYQPQVNKERSSTLSEKNIHGDINKSMNKKLSVSSSGNNMEKTVGFDLANKNADKRETVSSEKSRSMLAENLENSFEALQENNRVSRRYSNRSYAAHGIENTEFRESRYTDVGTIVQSATHETVRSFTSIEYNGTGAVQQANLSSILGSQVTNAEKMSQIKSALEKVKTKEFANMKNTKIDSYFKITSTTKPVHDVAARDSQKLPNKKRPVGDRGKIVSVSPNKAYLVNGKVYKRPKLPRPKLWATDRLYNFLWKKLEPKYRLRTRIRSEQFVTDLGAVVALVVRRQKYDNYKGELKNLIREMARLGIIRTRNDFNIFCQDFLPYEFREKVIPMILPGNVRNIPFNPDKLHTPILT